MKKLIGFGEEVEGYSVRVLNEREIRASSGIYFVLALISLMLIIFKKDFILAKFFVVIFLVDFLIRVFVNPKYSPSLILGRLIVKNQTPEYVGAPQKKFAWKIGITLATTMFFLMNIYNTYSFITGLICLICLIFLFFESSFGICLGCLFYRFFYKEEVQYCPGEICEVKDRQEIQKVSGRQVLILLSYGVFIVLIVVALNAFFKQQPDHLWTKLGWVKR